MCGIAGTWSKNEPNFARIESSLKLLCHRGPDNQKYETFKTKNERFRKTRKRKR